MRTLHAHTLSEAKLYLFAQSCPQCDRGPMHADRAGSLSDSTAGSARAETFGGEPVELTAYCASCQASLTERFEIDLSTLDELNPTGSPSRILDVTDWVALSSALLELADRQDAAAGKRSLKIEAADCLREALKFYGDDDNDLPPASACFSAEARDRVRDFPNEYSRQRLRDLLAKLPRRI